MNQDSPCAWECVHKYAPFIVFIVFFKYKKTVYAIGEYTENRLDALNRVRLSAPLSRPQDTSWQWFTIPIPFNRFPSVPQKEGRNKDIFLQGNSFLDSSQWQPHMTPLSFLHNVSYKKIHSLEFENSFLGKWLSRNQVESFEICVLVISW